MFDKPRMQFKFLNAYLDAMAEGAEACYQDIYHKILSHAEERGQNADEIKIILDSRPFDIACFSGLISISFATAVKKFKNSSSHYVFRKGLITRIKKRSMDPETATLISSSVESLLDITMENYKTMPRRDAIYAFPKIILTNYYFLDNTSRLAAIIDIDHELNSYIADQLKTNGALWLLEYERDFIHLYG